MSMWGGRFSATPNDLVAMMSQSVSYDKRMYAHDIRASIAHADMLAAQEIIPRKDADEIIAGLTAIKADIDAGNFEWSAKLEDLHMNIESRLTERIGAAGGRLHSARSRNDQVATDMRLFFRDECGMVVELLRTLQKALVELAAEHTDTVLPGFTHLQHAQPIVLAHYLLAYVEMFDRDIGRVEDCAKRMNFLPLGSGAMAGTTLPIDRERVCAALEFSGVMRNSMDGVSDRDFMCELLFSVAMIMMHLSRISEDFIFWISQEAGWIELGDTFCTGSSLMPQKKNPDVCELTRGKTGRVYGGLVTLLTVMKGMPLCYNRDMQEDKEPVFDALDTVKTLLQVWTPMVKSVQVNKERMRAAAADPALMATDLAEWLVKNGVPFRTAHHRVGSLVGFSKEKGIPLDKITLEQMIEIIPEANEECLELWVPEKSVAMRDTTGGTAPNQARIQVAFWQSKFAE